jgi:hypothetical protein
VPQPRRTWSQSSHPISNLMPFSSLPVLARDLFPFRFSTCCVLSFLGQGQKGKYRI